MGTSPNLCAFHLAAVCKPAPGPYDERMEDARVLADQPLIFMHESGLPKLAQEEQLTWGD